MKNKAATCEFGDQRELMIREKIIFGVRDQRVKERLLRDGDQSLAKVLDACRATESSKQQLQAMTAAQTQHVNTTNKGAGPKNRKSKATRHNEGGNMKQNCGFCGQNYPPRKCPAWGATCSKYRGRTHFAQVCKKEKPGPGKNKPVRAVDEEFNYSEYGLDPESQAQGLFTGTCFVRNLSTTRDKWQAPWQVCLLATCHLPAGNSTHSLQIGTLP